MNSPAANLLIPAKNAVSKVLYIRIQLFDSVLQILTLPSSTEEQQSIEDGKDCSVNGHTLLPPHYYHNTVTTSTPINMYKEG